MKLLIVDDEELTRTGVISSLDWNSLGITEVLQADDGVHGLETARLCKPEIVLCDVRMPRMDGITMLERLEKFLPDTVPIFMSGYSDKEYLKAAIKLKAVNYIEKPFSLAEIEAAIREARELYIQKVHSRRGETLHSMETASRLALQLTMPYGMNASTIEQLARDLNLTLNGGTYFTAFIAKTSLFLESAAPPMTDFYQQFQDFLEPFHMKCIYLEKKMQYLVYFLFSQNEPTARQLQSVSNFLCEHFAEFGRYSMACGDTACGISKAYQTYTSAVILLQSSYFFPENTLLTTVELNETPDVQNNIFADTPAADFADALSHLDNAAAQTVLQRLYDTFYKNHRFLQNPVKDLYYKLFLCLEDARHQQKIAGSGNVESIAETIDDCFTFPELHQTLLDKTAEYFEKAESTSQENPTIFLIKDYISKNYMNETLSVKDISTHVFLSTSYVCTFFKSETGQTLNQYLTEYRMEKAKQLLKDARFKISDISSRVGYSDGNYFGKSFKKYSGLSPSEYREQNLQ
ncbi:response regulator transcription factor [Blautia sp. MSJ-19]|uniref:response regulator transcription factor n=1 Tax=Blautia sp. MSJ-19 TaxID=2841517 RepID=UPI001C0EF2E2|nr:response regulator [Blautia sp. MSJ-19]MBU5480560.1 response regulator [Blautia sp. MSJ-19]